LRPEWDVVETETVTRLQAIIQFNTTNPPGNELSLARYLEEALKSEGIETVLLEPTQNRAQLYARIRGSGARRPVILLAHMDVVGVERENWSCDPFSGDIREGYLYGRGAIDDKGMLAANLMTMLTLKRSLAQSGETLSRDVVFIATSDEEGGGEWGMGWLVDQYPQLLDAEFALNEGGRTRIVRDGVTYLAVQSAEKISHVVTVTAQGTGGHAAVPLPDNAIFRLARALETLSHYAEPVMLTEITRRFFGRLAEIWPDSAEKQAMIDLVSKEPERIQNGAAVLSRINVFNAVLRNGISPAIVSGGEQHNVIPASAGALLNVRTLPGQSIDKVVSRMRAVVTEPGVTIEITQRGLEAPASDPDSPMFNAIADSCRELDPNISVVPYLSTGVTDSARLRILGVQAYGVLPFPMVEADERRMHAADERVPLVSLHFGTRLIFGAIARIAR
jgi:acetylornithine deacetylase/succinyl-diaminopimelate desuccinylase-like protein